MQIARKRIIALCFGTLLGMIGFNLVGGHLSPVVAAPPDDTRQQRMKEDQWTVGDLSRDALDHLKKAEEEMGRVASKEDSKVAKDAAKLSADARAKVDQFIAELDAKEKKPK